MYWEQAENTVQHLVQHLVKKYMAIRTSTQFKTLYGTSGTEFADNTTGLITAAKQRAMGEDIADSFSTNEGILSGTASGTDTYAVTIAGVASYASGNTYTVKFTNANTTAATININSLGAKDIKKGVTTALSAGNIAAGQIFVLAYDGTNFILLGAPSAAVTVSDTAFATSWNGETAEAPSKNTVYDMAGGLITKVIEIGDWNMDSTETVYVTHGIDWTKLRAICDVMIRDDSGNMYKLDANVEMSTTTKDGGVVLYETTTPQNGLSSTAILLYRVTGGIFDSVSFNATAYNRGWVTIQYAV